MEPLRNPGRFRLSSCLLCQAFRRWPTWTSISRSGQEPSSCWSTLDVCRWTDATRRQVIRGAAVPTELRGLARRLTAPQTLSGVAMVLARTSTLVLLSLSIWQSASAEPVRTLKKTGKSANRVDIVVLGDGYTAQEIAQSSYRSDVSSLITAIFAEEPSARTTGTLMCRISRSRARSRARIIPARVLLRTQHSTRPTIVRGFND